MFKVNRNMFIDFEQEMFAQQRSAHATTFMSTSA